MVILPKGKLKIIFFILTHQPPELQVPGTRNASVHWFFDLPNTARTS